MDLPNNKPILIRQHAITNSFKNSIDYKWLIRKKNTKNKSLKKFIDKFLLLKIK